MKKISGFTLLELLTTVAIAGVVMALAVPAMKSFVQRGKMTSYGNELVSAIQLARANAIKNAGFACVCPTTNAMDAVPACSGSNDWETGWMAFSDSTGDCVFNPADATPDVLIKVMDDDGFDNFTVRNNNSSINSLDYIRFNSRGVPVQPGGASQQGMFTICDERGVGLDANGDSITRGIELSGAGSVRSLRDAAKLTSCP